MRAQQFQHAQRPAARLICALAISQAFLFSAGAQPVPKLNALSHEWILRGANAGLELYGENLGGAERLIISGAPGVTAKIKPIVANATGLESSLGGIQSAPRQDQNRVQLDIDVSTNAPLTGREIRVVTPTGVSNPLTFNLSPIPEIASNNSQSREKPQDLSLPIIVSGTIRNAAESDFYRFEGKKDQHVIVDVNAYRSGSKLDSSLAVSDADGKELVRSEDAAGLDSVLDFKVPHDGAYTIELRDFRYQGGGDYSYRMTVGVLPHIFSAFPYGGQRGQTIDLAVNAVNFDSPSLHIAIDRDAPLGRQELRAARGDQLSNPIIFEVSNSPSVAESEPNSTLPQANTLPIPGAADGHIEAKKDADIFKFKASKGERIIFEVNAYRHGSPLDAVLTLKDASGAVLQRNDDAIGTDARIDQTFDKDGEFYISVEDLLGRGGSDFGYRLAASVPKPNFALTVTRDTPRVHRGGRVPIRCELNRMNGFGETVKVICEDLPSGLHADPLLLDGANTTGLLIIEADNAAALGSFPLKIAAIARQNRREAQALSNDRPVKEAFITVLDPAPFTLSPTTLLATVEQNENENIDLIVERKSGFAGEIRVNPEGFSTGRDPISRSFDVQPLVLKQNENRGSISLHARTDSEITTREVVLRAEADQGGSTITEYSAPIPVRTLQIPFVLSTSLKRLVVTALPSSSTSAAREAVFTVKCERRGGFEGEIALKLDGVPEGITATVPNIPEKGNEATVKLVASEKAAVKKDIALTLTGAGVRKDRTYRIAAGPVTLTIDAPASDENPKLAHTP
jgi:hypothetical protein